MAKNMSIFCTLPFIGVVLSVALLPLWTPLCWHKHAGKILMAFPIVLASYSAFSGNLALFLEASRETLLRDYFPFLILIASLYGIAGGIHITVPQRTSPLLNTGWLAIATLLAGWIGTTGASMVCIRPFLRLNADRVHKTHLVVFFIFLVSNIGGGMSPLGDPPLFMGFLQGVDFFWVPKNLCWPVLGTSLALLSIFFAVDTFSWRKESKSPLSEPSRIHCLGKRNIGLLGGAVFLVVLAGQDVGTCQVFGISLPVMGLIRDGGLLVLLSISLLKTPQFVYARNAFEWEPIYEIVKIFFAIFITLIPIETALHEETGLSHTLTEALSVNEKLSPFRCFWVSGLLSSFLDNTPTYLFFFHLFGGDSTTLMTTQAALLSSISLGSVFMGAVTYIGNAPNLMVAAIARKRFPKQVPSFLGYMGWSIIILFPVFSALSLVLFN
ncbi:MAG: sodium:proton antiporter [Holosporales bacterium]|jgi:Na+/H+ antiporter NhaD/arsenite permease-like protein|nr:sodium:proton antiporter [Holosporales bacterium]